MNASGQIRKGDLVMVVRWPHKCAPLPNDLCAGTPFVVTRLAEGLCFACGENLGLMATDDYQAGSRWRGVPVAWLKKIDPEHESSDTHTEISA